MTRCLSNVFRNTTKTVCPKFGASWNVTHELIQNLATPTDNMKVGVSASFDLKTYRPSRGTSADPFAPTDATILAGAPCLAFPGTRLLTAGGKDGVDP